MKRIHLLIIMLLVVLGFAGYNLIRNVSENMGKTAIKTNTMSSYIDDIENNNYTLAVVVDLDGNGIETTPLENVENIYFDYNGDRFKEHTVWVNSDDAFLVMDVNNDGIIDKGEELFGSNMSFEDKNNPFYSLLKLDENGDNKISEKDSAFQKIFIWQDINQNAVFDNDEKLVSLAELDVEAVSLDYAENGFDFERVGAITLNKNNGENIQAEAVMLKIDGLHTQAMDILEETPEIANMPNVQGHGKIYTLHQAMLRNDSLKNLVIQFGMEKNKEARKEIFDNIIFEWTGVADKPVNDRGQYMDDGRKLYAMEMLFNNKYKTTDNNGNPTEIPNKEQAATLMQIYDDTIIGFYKDLLMQTHFVEVGDSIGLDGSDLTHTAELVYNKVQEIDEPDFIPYFTEALIAYNEYCPDEYDVDLDSFVDYFEENCPEYAEAIKKVLEQ